MAHPLAPLLAPMMTPLMGALMTLPQPHLPGSESALNWFSGTEAQLKSASCKVERAPSLAHMQTEVLRLTESTPRVNKTIHDLRLVNQPEKLVQAFENLVMNDERKPLTLRAQFSVPESCADVFCATRAIWGELYGTQLLYLNLRFGYNASELAFENSERMQPEEIEDVLIGLEDLPHTLTPMSRNKRLTRFLKGRTLKIYEGKPVAANAVIMLFDHWAEMPRWERQYTIFHEVSHNLSTRFKNLDGSASWKKVSGWDTGQAACAPSLYGASSIGEDFAETVSQYRYAPQALENQCPQKYQFIKEQVFGGLEFKDWNSCLLGVTPTQWAQQYLQSVQLKDFVNSLDRLSHPAIENLRVRCQQLATRPLLESCVEGELARAFEILPKSAAASVTASPPTPMSMRGASLAAHQLGLKLALRSYLAQHRLLGNLSELQLWADDELRFQGMDAQQLWQTLFSSRMAPPMKGHFGDEQGYQAGDVQIIASGSGAVFRKTDPVPYHYQVRRGEQNLLVKDPKKSNYENQMRAVKLFMRLAMTRGAR